MSEQDRRTPVLVVAGWSNATRRVARSLSTPGTVVIRHDIGDAYLGVITRTVSAADSPRPHRELLDLVDGCVGCTVRADLLPLLRRLAVRRNVRRIVVVLDQTFEPQPVCWAIENTMVTGILGQLDGPASTDVRVTAVITCVDAATWFTDATGDESVSERLPGCDPFASDDRTVAQVVVGQVDYADLLVVAGEPADAFESLRLTAVLERLAPTAKIEWVGASGPIDAETILAPLPDTEKSGDFADPHGPLLRGEPPLDYDCGVALVEFTADRPFHPTRLHEALDVLLDGVVSARGRIWLASQMDNALWLESAGGGLRVGDAGRWLAAMTPDEREWESTERRAMAALRWNDRFGDRDTSLLTLVHAADPSHIERTLRWALVTDEEPARPQDWPTWPDPFGSWHEDPCGTTQSPFVDIEGEDHA